MASEIGPEAELDGVFHALADPTRRAIVARLAVRPTTVTELARPFAMSLPAVSKHLKVLEQAGLISRDADGRARRCTLRPTGLRNADDWLGPYRAFWQDHFEALDRALRGEAHRRTRPPEPGALGPSGPVTPPTARRRARQVR